MRKWQKADPAVQNAVSKISYAAHAGHYFLVHSAHVEFLQPPVEVVERITRQLEKAKQPSWAGVAPHEVVHIKFVHVSNGFALSVSGLDANTVGKYRGIFVAKNFVPMDANGLKETAKQLDKGKGLNPARNLKINLN